MSYKTEIKSNGCDLFFEFPVIFVKPLKWCEGDAIDIELVGNTVQMLKI